MANKKKTILEVLVTQLGNLVDVSKATRILLTPTDARKHSPYVGLIAGTEETIIEDSTHIRYELDVSIILLKRGLEIEEFLDVVKILLYDNSLATTIGALQIKIIGQEEVALIDADKYSSTRIATTITYVVEKGVF